MVVLDNKVLKYFKQEKKGDATMQGVLNFDLYAVELVKVEGAS